MLALLNEWGIQCNGLGPELLVARLDERDAIAIGGVDGGRAALPFPSDIVGVIGREIGRNATPGICAFK